jgi:hypothetical protein
MNVIGVFITSALLLLNAEHVNAQNIGEVMNAFKDISKNRDQPIHSSSPSNIAANRLEKFFDKYDDSIAKGYGENKQFRLGLEETVLSGFCKATDNRRAENTNNVISRYISDTYIYAVSGKYQDERSYKSHQHHILNMNNGLWGKYMIDCDGLTPEMIVNTVHRRANLFKTVVQPQLIRQSIAKEEEEKRQFISLYGEPYCKRLVSNQAVRRYIFLLNTAKKEKVENKLQILWNPSFSHAVASSKIVQHANQMKINAIVACANELREKEDYVLFGSTPLSASDDVSLAGSLSDVHINFLWAFYDPEVISIFDNISKDGLDIYQKALATEIAKKNSK